MDMENTPWGRVESATKIAEGIFSVETASHGGIILSAERAALIPPEIVPWTRDRHYWEEDADWAVPCLMFAEEWDALEDFVLDAATKSLMPEDLEIIKTARVALGLPSMPCFIGP